MRVIARVQQAPFEIFESLGIGRHISQTRKAVDLPGAMVRRVRRGEISSEHADAVNWLFLDRDTQNVNKKSVKFEERVWSQGGRANRVIMKARFLWL